MAYDNPAGLIAMSVIFEALAIGAVLLRFISRRKTRAGLRADDWFIFGALLVGTGLFIVEVYGIAVEAFGTPYTRVSPPALEKWRISMNLQFAYLLLNIAAVTLVKLSTIFLYRRLFMTINSFRIFSIVWIVILIAWWISFTMWMIFKCGSHVSAYFGTYKDISKYCTKHNEASLVMVGSDVATDAITLFMPLPMIFRLHTSIRRKVAIAAVFALGAFSVAASATRLAIYVQSKHGTSDSLILLTKQSVWNYLEPMVGICATCAITFGPLLTDFNLSAYMTSLSSLRDGLLSPMFSKRESIDSRATDNSDDVRNTDEKLASGATVKSRRSETEASQCNEKVRATDSQGGITVERSYNISLRGQDDEIGHVQTARGNSFC